MANDDPKNTEEEIRRLEKRLADVKIQFQEAASVFKEKISINIDVEDARNNLGNLKNTLEQVNKQATENVGLNSDNLDAGIESLQALERYSLQLMNIGQLTKDEYEEIKKQVEEKKKKYEYSKQDVEESKKAFENSLMLNKDTFQLGKKLEVINRIKNANLSVEEKANYRRQFALALMTAMVDKINAIATASLKTALALDDSVRGLMRGANFSYQQALDSLIEMAPMAAASGLSIDNLGNSMNVLKQEFMGFTSLNKEQQSSLALTVAQLDNIGFAASSSAGFLETATKSLAMSEVQATGFLTSLKGFADESGITMQQLSKNINGSREQIVKFGQDGPRVFKEMSLASKQLGLELNTLFDITERFATFQGAADAAGKLNAILGGDFINSVDLLTAGLEDPIDVFEQLKFGLDESGKSFLDLDNASRRAIAAAAGLSLEQASRIFTMDINSATAAMREQEKTQEDMAKISADMTGIQQRLQRAFIALYPSIKPLIEAFASAAESFSKFMIGVAKYLNDSPNLVSTLKVLAIAFVGIMVPLAALATVILPLLTLFASLKAVGMSLGFVYGALKAPLVFLRGAIAAGIGVKQADVVVTGEQAVAEEAASKAKLRSARASRIKAAAMRSSMLSMAGVAAGIGVLLVGVGAAAYGVSHLAAAFKGMGKDADAAVAGILAFGIAVSLVIAIVGLLGAGPQAIAIAAGVAVLLAFGAAAMMMGEGIKNAGSHIKTFTEGIPDLLAEMATLTPAEMKPWIDLADAFEKMADSLSKVSSYSSVLSKLSENPLASSGGTTTSQPITFSNPVIEFMAVSAPETNFANTGASVKKQDTSAMTDSSPITLNIVMDSPIEINGNEIARISSNATRQLMKGARNQTLTVNLDPNGKE